MNARTLALAIAFFLLAVFALLNWSAFAAPTSLSLGFAEVQAPLGLVMLVVTGIVSGLFLVYIVVQQAGAILESRRYEKELRANRELADQAEASRFTELRAYLASELARLQGERAARRSRPARACSNSRSACSSGSRSRRAASWHTSARSRTSSTA
jgi:uncharacterized integral membrane protein